MILQSTTFTMKPSYLPPWNLIALLLATCLLYSEASEKQTITFQGQIFHTYTLDPHKTKLDLVWKDASGKPYASFKNVAQAVQQKGRRLKFITNAGIFEHGPAPEGIHN